MNVRVGIFTKPVGAGGEREITAQDCRPEWKYKKRRGIDRRRRVGSFNGQAAAAIGTLSAAIKIFLSLHI